MKKPSKPKNGDELREEYDAALIQSGVRGKYAKRFHEGAKFVSLDPDVASAFPDAKAVNDALRLLLTVANRSRADGKQAV